MVPMDASSSHAASSPETPEDLPFEQALTQLEEIVTALEDRNVSLEEALHAYERGVALARHCMGRLDAAELRVQELALE